MTVAVCTTALAAADAKAAVDAAPAPLQSAIGRWTLMLDDTNRKCRLTLRGEPRAGMFAVGLPAGCRRALPILSSVSRWTAASDGLRFDDDDGKPVLAFTSQKDASTLLAKGPEGEGYSLVAMDGAHVDGLPQTAVVTPVAAKTGTGKAGTAKTGTGKTDLQDPAKVTAAERSPDSANGAIDPGSLPGRYAILRRNGKDTGCELTLDPKAKGPKGSRKAILAPSCKDQGVVIFNPVGWRFENGCLTLVAKKGHATHLDLQKDGTWLKDPGEGAPLSLKKT